MAGWLACIVVMTVAGREATSRISVFEVMELRSLIGIVLLYPLVRRNGGFREMRTAPSVSAASECWRIKVRCRAPPVPKS